MTEDPKFIVAPYRSVLQWASQHGVRFRTIEDLGAVNRKRMSMGLPQMRIGGADTDSYSDASDEGASYAERVPAAIAERERASDERVAKDQAARAAESNPPAPQSGALVPARAASVHEAEAVEPADDPPRRRPVPKNMRGLAHALFDELNAYRNGRSTVDEVRVVCEVSGRIANIMHAEVKLRNAIERSSDAETKRHLRRIAGDDDEIDHDERPA